MLVGLLCYAKFCEQFAARFLLSSGGWILSDDHDRKGCMPRQFLRVEYKMGSFLQLSVAEGDYGIACDMTGQPKARQTDT